MSNLCTILSGYVMIFCCRINRMARSSCMVTRRSHIRIFGIIELTSTPALGEAACLPAWQLKHQLSSYFRVTLGDFSKKLTSVLASRSFAIGTFITFFCRLSSPYFAAARTRRLFSFGPSQSGRHVATTYSFAVLLCDRLRRRDSTQCRGCALCGTSGACIAIIDLRSRPKRQNSRQSLRRTGHYR